ncbi:sulfite exporter TauE/SafE family protein [Thermodesulfobacteriota bacterium B35]
MQANIFYYLTAILLGGMHALEPGHGKTVVAAYLVGSRGRKMDAFLLGLVVTLTHTFSVILLAIAAKIASDRMTLSEDALHGYLGLVAGVLILVVGLLMLIQRIRGRDIFHFHSHGHGHDHNHGTDHGHTHGDHTHEHHAHDAHDHSHHGHAGHHHDHHDHEHAADHAHGDGHHHSHAPVAAPGERVSYWRLFLLGLSGGLVPCPAAIAILLAAAAAGKLGEGLTYILLFSIGLAIVLIAIGITVVSAGKFAARFLDAKRFARKISIASAGLITLIGIATLVDSIRTII